MSDDKKKISLDQLNDDLEDTTTQEAEISAPVKTKKDFSAMNTVDTSKMPTRKELEDAEKKKETMDEILASVDAGIERKKQKDIQMGQYREQLKAAAELEKEIESDADDLEASLDADLDEDANIEKVTTVKEDNISETAKSIFDVDDDDFSELEEDEAEKKKEKEEEAQLDTMKSKIKEKLKPVLTPLDLKTFTISKDSVSAVNAIKTVQVENKREIIDWVLPASNKVISMQEFSGFEIEKLNPDNYGRNRLNTYKSIFKIIYDHVIDANKPATLEGWLKTINWFDYEHLYFAIYKASFLNSNFIPYSCPNESCKEIFIAEDRSIDDMIKYKDDAAKKKIQDLLENSSNSEKTTFNVELVQISDNYVFGLKDPSLYNMIFENILLDPAFTEKYADLLSYAAYIDEIYLIDHENNQLRPIEIKQYADNQAKSIKSKINVYSKILNNLNSDQYKLFDSCIRAIQDKHDEITYQIPETKCPKCGKVIEAAAMPADRLLFTRHQLEAIANS